MGSHETTHTEEAGTPSGQVIAHKDCATPVSVKNFDEYHQTYLKTGKGSTYADIQGTWVLRSRRAGLELAWTPSSRSQVWLSGSGTMDSFMGGIMHDGVARFVMETGHIVEVSASGSMISFTVNSLYRSSYRIKA
jgi:hypothetical protein